MHVGNRCRELQVNLHLHSISSKISLTAACEHRFKSVKLHVVRPVKLWAVDHTGVLGKRFRQHIRQ